MARRMRGIALVIGTALALGLLPGCTDGEEDTAAEELPPAELDDLVSLTIYLRTGGSSEDLLEPVSREVPIGDDLPRRAVQLLLAGPEGADEEGLESPWPSGTELHDVRIADGTATVDLSGDTLDDAPEPDRAAHVESLALASLANTLTEFPAVETVKVTFDGQDVDSEDVEEFWGGWGLPETLTRDVTLVVDESEEGPPSLDSFDTEQQTVGTGDAETVVIRSVRVRDRITYLRLVVELADTEEPDRSAPEFPRTYARSDPSEVVLEITDVDEVGDGAVPSDLAEQLEALFSDVEVGEGMRSDSVRIRLEPTSEDAHRVYLHTATSPSRIVLDVKK